MRPYELSIVCLAALASQALAIQVECRQATIIRRNEDYFDRAKKSVHPGADDIKTVEDVSHSYMGIDPEALVEHATTLALVPRNFDQDEHSYSAQQIRLQQDMSFYSHYNEA